MDFQRLTLKSQEAVAAAQDLARRTGNPELMPDHLLLALLEEKTRGNLTAEERQFLDQILYELRLRYVEASQQGSAPEPSRIIIP